EPLRSTAPPVPPPAASVLIVILLASRMPPVAALKSTLPEPALLSVRILPLSVARPVAPTVNDRSAVAGPTAVSQTAPAALMVRPCTPAVGASTAFANVSAPAPDEVNVAEAPSVTGSLYVCAPLVVIAPPPKSVAPSAFVIRLARALVPPTTPLNRVAPPLLL